MSIAMGSKPFRFRTMIPREQVVKARNNGRSYFDVREAAVLIAEEMLKNGAVLISEQRSPNSDHLIVQCDVYTLAKQRKLP